MDRGSTAAGWDNLITMDDGACMEALAERFRVLAAQDETARRAALADLAAFAYALPDADLQRLTKARLRALLALDDTALRALALSFDAVLDAMPAAVAMRRVALAQHAARTLTVEERERLHGLEPGIAAGAPVGSIVVNATSKGGGRANATAPARRSRRPFWRGSDRK